MTEPVHRIAFVGLGAMGSRVALRLLGAGHEVVAWNRTAARTAELPGVTPAPTPAAAAAGADVVMTMVSDPSALRAVTEAPDGVAAGAGTGTTVIEMSTVGPAAVARLSATLPDGVGLLDAPVLGSLPEAESGALTIFMGGPPPLVEEWTSLLSTLGTPLHVGPLGAGAAAKLVANSTLFGVLGVLGEAVALAEGLGLSSEAVQRVLAASPLAAHAQRWLPALESGQYPLRFSLSLARKDAQLVAEAAAGAGVQMRLAAAALTWLADAEAAGKGQQDYTALLAHIVS